MSWAQIKQAVNSNLSKPLNELIEEKHSTVAQKSTALSTGTWTKARAGYLDYLANSTYGLSALNTKITSIQNNGNKVIKSIQRGVTSGPAGSIAIKIASVVPEKCMVILDNSYSSDSSSDIKTAYLISITGTSLTVGTNTRSGIKYDFSWQVIEFN